MGLSGRLRWLCIPGTYARVSLVRLSIAWSWSNESDRLIPGENTFPMIHGDAIKRTTSPRAI